MPQRNVLHVNEHQEQADYLDAVADIIREVQHDHKVTLLEISERIGVSLGTVSNAANKKGVLNALYLNRIGRAFGCHHLDPYARLAGGRVIPTDTDDGVDVLPTLSLAGHKIALARSPASPGGTHETLREQLGYLPELRRLQREVGALIARIETRKDAA